MTNNEQFLLATDGSTGAEKTIAYCKDTFAPERVSFIVFHVIQPTPPDVEADLMDSPMLGEMEKLKQQRSTEIVEHGRNELEEAGFDVKTATPNGRAGIEICDFAREQNMDGIVIGRKGHTALGEILLGSTSQYVIRHAPCPVTVVPLDY
ncbi:MAG: universal stress protein [bacterium]